MMSSSLIEPFGKLKCEQHRSMGYAIFCCASTASQEYWRTSLA